MKHNGKDVVKITGEDMAVAGRKIYEAIRAEMESNHWGKLVVIDINSGDYEVGEYESRRSDMKITERLLGRQPDALTWAVLVGYPAPYYRKPGRRGLFPMIHGQKVADD